MSFYKEFCIQGWKYQFGIYVEKNLEKAFDFYKQATDLGDGEGMFQIAEFYHLGIHVKKDRNNAFEYFQKSASTGFEMGIVKKAFCNRYGYGTQENYNYSEELLNTLEIMGLYSFALARHRPTAEDINNTVEEWSKNEEIMGQFETADEYRPQLVEQIHPKEMFTSKLINVREISKKLSEMAIVPSKPMEHVNIQDDF
ncbi:sel1 repeat family protein [Gigaspora margarita]|uniref:Sel1 repeat family protein n=1 Tax=Gigaspora margarita TaxID=4874 RepID=A0A8H4AUN9_GIGMA|nr:sel1 repeat family protein [Gigaspora margarita]